MLLPTLSMKELLKHTHFIYQREEYTPTHTKYSNHSGANN